MALLRSPRLLVFFAPCPLSEARCFESRFYDPREIIIAENYYRFRALFLKSQPRLSFILTHKLFRLTDGNEREGLYLGIRYPRTRAWTGGGEKGQSPTAFRLLCAYLL